jgi:hypothetical protein
VDLGDRLRNLGRAVGGERHPDGEAEVHIGDASFDDWDVIRDFSELETARAWRQSLTDRGVEAVLTADWPLDEYGRGDIALRVPNGKGVAAGDMLEDAEP